MDGDFNCRIWQSEPGLLNQRVCKLTPNDNYLNRAFLAYLLPGYLNLINDHTHSITVKHLSSRTIADIPCPLPPLDEQHRIVAKLDRLFARTRRAREELARIPRLIEHYKQAILTAAFRGELTADWRSTRDLKQWHNCCLSDLLAEPLANGRSIPDGEGFPVLRLTALHGRDLNLSERKLGRWDRRDAEKFLVRRGDFFVSRGNGSLGLVARGSYVRAEPDEVAFPDTMIRIRLRQDMADTAFIYYQWQSVEVRAQIVAAARTTAGIYKVSQKDLAKIQLVIPTLEEQQLIAARVEAAFQFVERVASEQNAAGLLLDHLDQALLAKAFRGELVPQDPADEPAAALLARIRAARAAEPKSPRGPAHRRRKADAG